MASETIPAPLIKQSSKRFTLFSRKSSPSISKKSLNESSMSSKSDKEVEEEMQYAGWDKNKIDVAPYETLYESRGSCKFFTNSRKTITTSCCTDVTSKESIFLANDHVNEYVNADPTRQSMSFSGKRRELYLGPVREETELATSFSNLIQIKQKNLRASTSNHSSLKLDSSRTDLTEDFSSASTSALPRSLNSSANSTRGGGGVGPLSNSLKMKNFELAKRLLEVVTIMHIHLIVCIIYTIVLYMHTNDRMSSWLPSKRVLTYDPRK